ncbi:MAG: hypothetical protein IH946_08075 [Bacteroidetes bacterium]|nr:hypothetical protein [Bacteroidota bacterium]
MKRIKFIFLVLLLSAFSEVELKKIAELEVNARFLTTDNLRQFYVIANNNELQKYDVKGNLLKTYSEKKHGQLKYLSADNPMKLLLFYPDFYFLVMLDNTLSETGSINLQRLNFQLPKAVCISFDNRIWLYDELNFQLIKIDENGLVVQQSENLLTLLGIALKFNFLTEENNWLYVNDPDVGILIFDIYGTYNKTLPIKGLDYFQVVQDNIIYYKDGKLIRYNNLTFEEQEIPMPPDISGVKQVRIENNLLYILTKNGVVLFSF